MVAGKGKSLGKQGKKQRSANVQGLMLTLFGGLFWGISGTNSEYLMKHYAIEPLQLSAFRLLIAGLLLLAYVSIRNRGILRAFGRVRSNWVQLLAFTSVGLLANQLAYLYSIRSTNAGTATVLQYIAPIMILLYACVRFRKLPTKRELLAIVLTFSGIFVITTHGDPTTLVLSPEGMTWGMISAFTLCFYNLLPMRLIAQWGALLVNGLAMTIGGFCLMLYVRPWENPLPLDGVGWIAMAIVILFGTLFAYVFYLTGVQKIGPVKASMLASVEPVVATVCTVVLMNTSFTAYDLLGFVLILVTVFVLAKREKKEVSG